MNSKEIQEQIDAYLEKAKTAREQEDYEKALSFCNKVIALDGNNAKAYYRRGTIYNDLKDYKQAIKEYNQAIALDANFAYPYNGRGNVYAELKNYEQAIKEFNQAIALDRNLAAAYNGRGNVYAELKNYEQAIKEFNQAIVLDGNNVNVYNNLGTIFHDLKKYNKALEKYNQAIILNEKYAPVYVNRGNVYTELKDYEKAIKDYNKAIELSENSAIIYLNKGNAYYKLEEYEEALANFNKAIALDKNYVMAYDIRGIIYSNLKDYEQSKTNWLKASHLRNIRASYNLLVLHKSHWQLAPFLRLRIIEKLPSSLYNEFASVIVATFRESKAFSLYVEYLSVLHNTGKIDTLAYTKLSVFIHYYMGDVFTTHKMIRNDYLPLQPTSLQAYYYLIDSAMEFHEPYQEDLQAALQLAAVYVKKADTSLFSWLSFFSKKENIEITEEKAIDMYYAGLIFMLTEDWEKAIRCFKQAEQMFLPAAYQLFSIYELRYGGSKARKQAEKIFEQEKEFEQNTNKFYFAKALPTQELALDTTAISQNIEHIIHYFECSNAIEILALHYRNEQKALNIRFSMPKKAIQFHELFTFSENEEHEIQKVISRYYTAALGKEILKQKLADDQRIKQLQEINIADKLENEELGKVSDAFLEMQERQNIEYFLVNKIYAAEIAADKLKLLVLAALTAQKINQTTYLMLLLYVEECTKHQKASLPAYLEEGGVDLAKEGVKELLKYLVGKGIMGFFGSVTVVLSGQIFTSVILTGLATSIVFVTRKMYANNTSEKPMLYKDFKANFLYYLGEAKANRELQYIDAKSFKALEEWAKRE